MISKSAKSAAVRKTLRAGAAALAAGSLALVSAAPSFAGQWGYPSAPQTVYNGGQATGQSYGNVSASGGNLNATGGVRDLVVGGSTIYVKLQNSYIYDGYVSYMDYTSARYNSGYWTSISVSSPITSTMFRSNEYTCEDLRFAFDPCSASYLAYSR